MFHMRVTDAVRLHTFTTASDVVIDLPLDTAVRYMSVNVRDL
jgi:hypothetical protein